MGLPYLTECLSWAIEERAREDAYRYYHTDLLRAICQSLGAKNIQRFYDLMHPAPIDNRDGMEIATEWLNSRGFKVVE